MDADLDRKKGVAKVAEEAEPLPVTVVIPVRNEIASIDALLDAIVAQRPKAIVVVDAGSTDGTRQALRARIEKTPCLRLIEVDHAYPGVGRNLGTEAAETAWVVYIDGGTLPHEGWLTALWQGVADKPVSAGYGFYAPALTSRLARWFAQATLLPARQTADGLMRNHFTACSIVRRDAWEAVGGFPRFRAAEDRLFIMAVDRMGFIDLPAAAITWVGPADWATLWRRTVTLAEHSARAGRAGDWHWPTLRYWLVALTLILCLPYGGIVVLLGWLIRAERRLRRHRQEPALSRQFGDEMGVAGVLLLMDVALFVGWARRSLRNDTQTVVPASPAKR